MNENPNEKALKKAEIGAAVSLGLIVLSSVILTRIQYDPRGEAEGLGGHQFRIYSDPPGATLRLMNAEGESDHVIGLSNEKVLTVQDFLEKGQEAPDNWSFKVSLQKEGWTPAELTVEAAEARGRIVPSTPKPLPELRARSLTALFSYLVTYRKGVSAGLLLGFLGLLGFGRRVVLERRKRKVLERYEADPSTDSYVGKFLHGYLVTKVLGAGGFGKVYRVLDGNTLDEEDPKALKIVSYELYDYEKVTDPEEREAIILALETAKGRFMREMETLVTSDHPNICKILTYGREPNHDWVLMPVYEQSLKDLLGKKEAFTPDKILSIAKQMAEGLRYAHEHEIVHRDLKPDNVMIEGEGLRIIDFGVAKPKNKATLTAMNSIVGTAKYIAPEQVLGGSDYLLDQYPYGLILFEMLTRTFPFKLPIGDVGIMNQRLNEEPAKLRSVVPQYSEELEKVIARMLSREPQDRFPSIMDAYQAFEAAYHRSYKL